MRLPGQSAGASAISRSKGTTPSERALRFAMYHLNSAANPADEQVSIGARALTGDGYLGHVFWDTEIYVLPFYIATWPEAARALLMYRYHTLPGARAKAARMGWRGAMYAWESTDTGDETTPEQLTGPTGELIQVLCGTQEQHITADVAYAVWQYWEATGDDAFMIDAGAEILLETARFWADRASPEADGKCHIRGVIGPDEYHENIDDNAYTNVMARWNIRRGVEMAAVLRDRWPDRWGELSQQLHLDDAELQQWAAGGRFAGSRGFNPDSGLFEQFAGFFDLEEVDLLRYADRTMPLDVLLGRERTQRSQVVKQADVVALLALLPEECDARPGWRISASMSSAAAMAARSAAACTPSLRPDWAIWISRSATSVRPPRQILRTPRTAAPAASISPRSVGCGRRPCSVLPGCRCAPTPLAWIPTCRLPGSASALASIGAVVLSVS